MAAAATTLASSTPNTTSLLLHRLLYEADDLISNATDDMLALNGTDREGYTYNFSLPCDENGYPLNESEWFEDGGKKARTPLPGQTDFDAFLYIIIVLSFYAISMVLLMIKYIKREEEEVSLDYYYTEFVKRERFQNPRFKNKMALEREKPLIEKAQQLALKTLVNPTENVECCRPSKSAAARRGHASEAARLLGKSNSSRSQIHSSGARNVAVVESPGGGDACPSNTDKSSSASDKSSRDENDIYSFAPEATYEGEESAAFVSSRHQSRRFRGYDVSDKAGHGRHVYRWTPYCDTDSDTETVTPSENMSPSSPDGHFLCRSCSPQSGDSQFCSSEERTEVQVADRQRQDPHKEDFVVDIVYTPPETSL